MRILGIDPGSVKTGFGLIECRGQQVRAIHYGVIKTGSGDFPSRLKVIFQSISEVITEYQPNEFAIESVFVSNNASSALKLGQARGAAICAAVVADLPVGEYAPREIKQALVGKGSAEKSQVAHMVGLLLGISEKIPEDAADALAIALCHQHSASGQDRLAAAIGKQHPEINLRKIGRRRR
ncbi:MAG: crossover junction endodeoxyribonuclease RuvC [Xanthomonadales bacterium]|nr:crossover junction endodeoxyribonuclease RuvC [Xanthomonadales bacterium]